LGGKVNHAIHGQAVCQRCHVEVGQSDKVALFIQVSLEQFQPQIGLGRFKAKGVQFEHLFVASQQNGSIQQKAVNTLGYSGIQGL